MTLLSSLIQFVIDYLKQEPIENREEVVGLLSQARDKLESGEEEELEKEVEKMRKEEMEEIARIAEEFNDAAKNPILAKIEDNKRIKQENREFQQSLQLAEERLKQEELINTLEQENPFVAS